MRAIFLAALTLGSCAPADDTPGMVLSELASGTVAFLGTREFAPEEFAAGIRPSPAISDFAQSLCPGATLSSVTSAVSDPALATYVFDCPQR